MEPPPEPAVTEAELPPHLKRLRLLVTVLTLTMIAGVITITVLLVIRLGEDRRPVLVHPEMFTLPESVNAVSYSVIDGRTIVIGDDGVIRVFDSDSRSLLQEMMLER